MNISPEDQKDHLLLPKYTDVVRLFLEREKKCSLFQIERAPTDQRKDSIQVQGGELEVAYMNIGDPRAPLRSPLSST